MHTVGGALLIENVRSKVAVGLLSLRNNMSAMNSGCEMEKGVWVMKERHISNRDTDWSLVLIV